MKKNTVFKKKFFPIDLSLLSLSIFFLFSPNHALAIIETANDPNIVHLTILYTNDSHGNFWKNKNDEGGFAAQKTLVDSIRNDVKTKGGHVLVLSAGDINTGTPASDILDAEPDIVGMNYIGYDAMTLGNHEFDKPFSVLQKQQAWAKFPFLSANIYARDKKDNLPDFSQRLFPTHLEKNYDGIKVNIFGLTTEDTPKKTNPEGLAHLYFRPVLEEAQDLVPKLREQSDILIGLTHIGHYPQETHDPNAPGDVSLAKKVSGIDFILGGHTQTIVYPPDNINNTKILQAYEWGKYLGRIDLIYDKNQKKIIGSKYQLLPINQRDPHNNQAYVGEYIPEDPALLQILSSYQDQLGSKFKEVVGEFRDDFHGRPAHLGKETNLGRLISKAELKSIGGDVAIINNGGVRKSFPKGPVTYEDLLKLFPFKNTLCSVDLTINELKTYFEQVQDIVHVWGANLQKDSQHKITRLKIGNEDIDLATEHSSNSKKYRLVMNDFLAQGGDGYPVVNKHPNFQKTEAGVFQSILDYIKDNKVISNQDFNDEKFVGPENSLQSSQE